MEKGHCINGGILKNSTHTKVGPIVLQDETFNLSAHKVSFAIKKTVQHLAIRSEIRVYAGAHF